MNDERVRILAVLQCPDCGEIVHKNESRAETINVRDRGVAAIGDYRFTRCVGCGLQWVDYEQSKHNEAQVQKALSREVSDVK